MEPYKSCVKCKTFKPLSHYHKNGKSGHQTQCKACIHAVRMKRIKVVRQWAWDYLNEHPCIDCGHTEIPALQFDHRGEIKKFMAVSVMIANGYSHARVKAEVAKCDVRCANCHAMRTSVDQSWYADLDKSNKKGPHMAALHPPFACINVAPWGSHRFPGGSYMFTPGFLFSTKDVLVISIFSQMSRTKIAFRATVTIPATLLH